VEDLEFYADEEEEVAEEEGSNRTFIILVGALGGLLALGICAFLVWALWLGPNMAAQREAENQAILATNTAIAAGEAGVMVEEGATIPPTEEAPTTPADTPEPTSTKPPAAAATQATETPESEEGTEAPGEEATATPAEVAEITETPPSPTATRRPTVTPRPSSEGVPDTGIGALGGGALALGLMFLLLVVRRMRRAM
jgi:cytoskeletal protein RodZ